MAKEMELTVVTEIPERLQQFTVERNAIAGALVGRLHVPASPIFPGAQAVGRA